jgi:hypothetical protein
MRLLQAKIPCAASNVFGNPGTENKWAPTWLLANKGEQTPDSPDDHSENKSYQQSGDNAVLGIAKYETHGCNKQCDKKEYAENNQPCARHVFSVATERDRFL